MRDFFHGWRRKAGVVTLVMACGLMAMWLRTCFAADSLWMSANRHTLYILRSLDRRIVIEKCGHHIATYPHFSIRTSGWTEMDAIHMGDIEWQWQWCGFARGTFDMFSADVWTIPYWSLASPLTLLSAYLILWKPRKRTGPDHA